MNLTPKGMLYVHKLIYISNYLCMIVDNLFFILMKNHIKWTIVKASFTYKTWNNQNICFFFYYCFFQPSNQGSLAKRLLTWIVRILIDHQIRILLNFLYLVKYANYQSVSSLTGNLTLLWSHLLDTVSIYGIQANLLYS